MVQGTFVSNTKAYAMADFRTAVITQPTNPNTLPLSQYDRRNVSSLRFLEVGFNLQSVANQAVRYQLPADTPPDELTFSLADIIGEYAFDRNKTFRILTIGLDNYSVRHEYPEGNDPGFEESKRQPIAIQIPQLMRHKERYVALLPNDFSYGLGSSVNLSFTSDAPSSLTFRVGVLNADPRDERLYNFNANRFGLNPATTNAIWHSQFITQITVRFFIRASFEPNYIPIAGNWECLAAAMHNSLMDRQVNGTGVNHQNATGGSAVGNATAANQTEPDNASSTQGDLSSLDTGWSQRGAGRVRGRPVGKPSTAATASTQPVDDDSDGDGRDGGWGEPDGVEELASAAVKAETLATGLERAGLPGLSTTGARALPPVIAGGAYFASAPATPTGSEAKKKF